MDKSVQAAYCRMKVSELLKNYQTFCQGCGTRAVSIPSYLPVHTKQLSLGLESLVDGHTLNEIVS